MALPRWHGFTDNDWTPKPPSAGQNPQTLPHFRGSAATRWSFLLKFSFTIIIVIMRLSASVFFFFQLSLFSSSGPSCSIFHFPPDIFLDTCYDRSLLNFFLELFPYFSSSSLFMLCVCVCVSVSETVTCSKSRTKSPTDTTVCYLTQPFINYLPCTSFLIAHCLPPSSAPSTLFLRRSNPQLFVVSFAYPNFHGNVCEKRASAGAALAEWAATEPLRLELRARQSQLVAVGFGGQI